MWWAAYSPGTQVFQYESTMDTWTPRGNISWAGHLLTWILMVVRTAVGGQGGRPWSLAFLLPPLTILDPSRYQHAGRLLDLVRILSTFHFHIFTARPAVDFEKVCLSRHPSLSL